MHHLLSLEGYTRAQLTKLLDAAESWLRAPDEPVARSDELAGRTVTNLFFEPSTRTRVSFELAAKRLGADIVNLDLVTSSRQKGESVLDTVYTLQAMQTDIFVVRDSEERTQRDIAEHVAPQVGVINAGEAHLAHPTQGLLDVLTIRQHKPEIEDLTVTIVGDIAHSRVARSTARALRILGNRSLRLVGPEQFLPEADEFPEAELTTDLDAALDGADVVMALRLQKERMDTGKLSHTINYAGKYCITNQRLKHARPDAIVMHPGPLNRDVEISSDIADGRQSVIFEQVRNGVAVRMAVLVAMNKTLTNA
ncbi:MAG: aspartate carbamoyltransferase catalytic subunit [Gammaproteobacteria bacterium]